MIKSLDKIIQDGVDRGVLQKFTSDHELNSSNISIDDCKYVNFGSCSYLGLEYHPLLKKSVKDTVDKYGTQFSTSRTYLSIGLYEKLETELSRMFEKPVIVSASTTLGHMAALPILVEEDDVVILDLQVHSSVQMSAQLLKANKISVHLIPHNNMESLEAKIKVLSEKANKIWYMADGVYSMYGDYAPLDKIEQLLNKYKKFHLYIDDAHGMGWTGENGIGYVRSKIAHHDKMVLATSLNKSFAASGGILIFPNTEMYRKVKNCGTTMIFSGPIQPPMLGAAIASSKLHQSEELVIAQENLKEKISFTNKRLYELELPQFKITDSPLFFIPVGLPNIIVGIIKRMKRKGFYINSASFPATPMKKGGLRFMVNNNLSISEIDEMLTTLRDEYIYGLLAEGSSPEIVAKQFKLTPFLLNHGLTIENNLSQTNLTSHYYDSINDLDNIEWNALFAHEGTNEANNLKELESIFNENEKIENNWGTKFHIIRDAKGEVVLASVYTVSLMMDDLFESKSISEKIKVLRKNDPYYLTSKTLITGTPFTKGKSVYINYNHDDWKEATKLYTQLLQKVADDNDVSKIILREFLNSDKKVLENYLMELGFLDFKLPNNCVVNNMEWKDNDELLASLTQKYRYSLRKEILKKEDDFIVNFNRPTSEKEKIHAYNLYKTVHGLSTEISVFELPFFLFEKMYNDPSYDFINLYLKEDDKESVAVMFSQVINGVYNAQLVGLNYNYVREKGTYKQILYQTVKRAKQLGCTKIDLAFTAEMEKKKVGAKVEENYAFIMALEHDSYAEMQLLK